MFPAGKIRKERIKKMGNSMKRFLALALALIMVIGVMPTNIASAVEGDAPEAPTATVTAADRADAAFAVTFTADSMSTEQAEYYGGWNIDLVLTVNKELTMNNCFPSEYSYLSIYCPPMLGSDNWVDMPGDLENNVVVPANTPWGLLAFGGMPVTYSQFTAVGGVGYAALFQEAYLEANPGLVATVSLVLTNPETNETVTAAKHTYTSPYKLPDLPNATVTDTPDAELSKDVPLTFAKTFTAETPDADQIAYYGNYYADFVLTVNKDVTFNADSETADGYLAGEYGDYGWIKVPPTDVTLKAGESLRIMEYAAELLNKSGLQFTYAEVVESVKSFNCGVYFTPEFLAANPDFEVSLELRLYETKEATEGQTIGESFTFDANDVVTPDLPSATVTEIQSKDLTFAMNFDADDITNAQMAYYGDWYADFELTINKDVTFDANGTGDGWLSGRYDAWNNGNWVKVPIEPVQIKANETLRIMEFAAELLGKQGLKMTYEEILENVQSFDCGVFFTPEFLAANPDLEVNLELRMYHPTNEDESYIIGETYTATVPELPTATVTETQNDDLTFSMNFFADQITDEQLAYYGDWYADFELTINKDVIFDANGTGDGWLSGQYDGWEIPGSGLNSEDWINVPFEPVQIKANESLKIMDFAAKMLGEPGLKYTYKEVYENVKDFNCGVFFTPEFLAANPDLKVTLKLRMYDPADETVGYTIGQTYEFENEFVAQNTTTKKLYGNVMDALMEAKAGESVILIQDVEETLVSVLADVTLDLNGNTLTASYMTCFGDIIDSSEDNSGLLKVSSTRFLIQKNNAQLPVKDGDGYRFVDVLGFNQKVKEGPKYIFQSLFEEDAHALLLAGQDITGVTVMIRVSWTQSQGTRTQDFVFNDAMVKGFIDSYGEKEEGKYGQQFALTLLGNTSITNLTFTAVVRSDTGVEFTSAN